MGLEAHVKTAPLSVPFVGHADRLTSIGLMNTALCILAMQVALHISALHFAEGPSESLGGPRGPTLKSCTRLAA